jgi:hypothetical protein
MPRIPLARQGASIVLAEMNLGSSFEASVKRSSCFRFRAEKYNYQDWFLSCVGWGANAVESPLTGEGTRTKLP